MHDINKTTINNNEVSLQSKNVITKLLESIQQGESGGFIVDRERFLQQLCNYSVLKELKTDLCKSLQEKFPDLQDYEIAFDISEIQPNTKLLFLPSTQQTLLDKNLDPEIFPFIHTDPEREYMGLDEYNLGTSTIYDYTKTVDAGSHTLCDYHGNYAISKNGECFTLVLPVNYTKTGQVIFNRVNVFNNTTREIQQELEYKDPIQNHSISFNTRYIAVITGDQLLVRDLETGVERVIKNKPFNRNDSLVFSVDGEFLALYEQDESGKQKQNKITVWNVRTGKMISDFNAKTKGYTAKIKFSPDSDYLFCKYDNNNGKKVEVLNIKTGEWATISYKEPFNDFFFSRDGSSLHISAVANIAGNHHSLNFPITKKSLQKFVNHPKASLEDLLDIYAQPYKYKKADQDIQEQILHRLTTGQVNYYDQVIDLPDYWSEAGKTPWFIVSQILQSKEKGEIEKYVFLRY